MELFNDTGFEIGDPVQVIIDQETYFGKVIGIDNDQNKIQVDYTAKSDKKPVIDWFNCKLWTKSQPLKKTL